MMLCLALAAALAFSSQDAAFAYDTATNIVARHTPRDAGTPAGRSAAEFIRDSARAAGAQARIDSFAADTPKGRREFANVVAEFPGDDGRGWVVLVSHYDTKTGTRCPGANDGASTSGLLVAFARALARRGGGGRSVMLLWTDGEECMDAYGPRDGLWGSRHAAAELAREGRRVDAVVCLDMLGDARLDAHVPRNSTPALRRAVLAAAKRAGVSDKVAASDMLVKDDHIPFLEKGFPAVDLIDFSFGSAPGINNWWHTPEDTPDKISAESLHVAGRLVVELLNDPGPWL